jgi:anti-sigma regulatory factor (Ser/Thr protein kinase)
MSPAPTKRSERAPRTPGPWQLPRDPTAPRLARRHLASELDDLPDDLVQVAQLLTSELVTNALIHGSGDIAVTVVRVEGGVTVRVADDGPRVPVVRDHDLAALSGKGL